MKDEIVVFIVCFIGFLLLFWFGVSVSNYTLTYTRVKALPEVDKLPTTEFMRNLKGRTVRVSDERVRAFMVTVKYSPYHFKDPDYWDHLSYLMVDNSKLMERIFNRSLRYGWDEEAYEQLACILYENDINHHYIGTRLVLRWVKDVHNAIIENLLRK